MSLGDIAHEHIRVCYLRAAEEGRLWDLRGSNREVQNTALTVASKHAVTISILAGCTDGLRIKPKAVAAALLSDVHDTYFNSEFGAQVLLSNGIAIWFTFMSLFQLVFPGSSLNLQSVAVISCTPAFDIRNFYVLLALCICVDIKTDSDNCPVQH